MTPDTLLTLHEAGMVGDDASPVPLTDAELQALGEDIITRAGRLTFGLPWCGIYQCQSCQHVYARPPTEPDRCPDCDSPHRVPQGITP